MIKRGMLAVMSAALVIGLFGVTGCGGKKDDNGGIPLPHDQSENAKSTSLTAPGPGGKGATPPPP
jgi:hypothetical protein